jgi:hypothetical protein
MVFNHEEGAMAKTVVLEDVRVAFRVPADLPDRNAGTVERVLRSPRFMRGLRRAIPDVIVKYPELAQVTLTLSR